MNRTHVFFTAGVSLLAAAALAAEPVVRTANNGNLVMER